MIKAVCTPSSYFHSALHLDFYILVTLIVGGYFIYNGIEILFSRWREMPVFRRTSQVLAPLYYAAALILIIVFSTEKTIFVYFRF